MPDAIFILHAEDAYLEGLLIFSQLDLMGLPSLLSSDALGRRSRLEASDAYFELLYESPLVIAVASEQLFLSHSLVTFVLAAKDTKKLIPVTFREITNPPVWFEDPILLSRPENGDSQGWNQLSQLLLHRFGNLFWQFPKPLSPKIN